MAEEVAQAAPEMKVSEEVMIQMISVHKYVAFDRVAQPIGIGGRCLNDTQEIEQANDQDQGGVLEQPDERVDDAGNHEFEGLGQDDQAHHLPVAQTEGLCGFVLALRNCLQTASNHLRHIGG